MTPIKFIEPTDLDTRCKFQMLNLWNKEYPVKLSFKNIDEFNEYLKNLSHLTHILLVDQNDKINGWAFSFYRENARWFAIILSEKIQGKGYGKKMLNELKSIEKELNGWVIDHNFDKKSDGKNYQSPLGFYLKCGFKILTDHRLELEKLSAVKIKWKR